MFLAWFWVSKLKIQGKITNIVIQVRVNGGSNNEYPGKHWVPKQYEFYIFGEIKEFALNELSSA